jgi:GrpB-like predicted nucleotidyltransferase (UPF0157 family)
MKRVTHDGIGWNNADEDFVEIEPYNPNWPDEFQREANRLRAALPRNLACSIEHIGSTAVSGLAAKPILDIVIACGERSRWDEFREPIESLEYVFWAENPHPNRMFFVKGMPPFGQRRTHHVHVRLPEDAVLEVVFRDALRAHPALARDYEALKRDLALRFRYDRDGYTEQKTQFIQEALGK